MAREGALIIAYDGQDRLRTLYNTSLYHISDMRRSSPNFCRKKMEKASFFEFFDMIPSFSDRAYLTEERRTSFRAKAKNPNLNRLLLHFPLKPFVHPTTTPKCNACGVITVVHVTLRINCVHFRLK